MKRSSDDTAARQLEGSVRITPASVGFRILAAVCAVPTTFFTFYGVQLIHASVTFEGEGSLGHVGMYVAALLFPLLALMFAGFTVLAWRRSNGRARHGERK